MKWRPIDTAPIKPFDPEKWYLSHSPYLLLWCGHARIGAYGYTARGKGRWMSNGRVYAPTHWMPLPDGPIDNPAEPGA